MLILETKFLSVSQSRLESHPALIKIVRCDAERVTFLCLQLFLPSFSNAQVLTDSVNEV